MSTITTPKITAQSIIAASLITYAESNHAFAGKFANLINQHISPANTACSFSVPSKFMQPASEEIAQERALWLMREIVHHTDDKELANSLAVWAQDHHNPQAAVLGIVGIAIIGPTLGLVKKKKKRKSQMRVAIYDNFYENSPVSKIVNTSQAAGLGILSDSLFDLSGDATRLDPELADWTFTDRETQLFLNSQSDLVNLKSILENEKLPYHTIETDDHINAIALHPMVSDSLPCGTLLNE